MPQEDARKLRRWLPEKRLRESISAENWMLLAAALAATVLFTCLDFFVKNDSIGEIMARIGITLSGIAVGFCLSNCWAGWKRGDSRRAEAIEIDQHVAIKIAKTVRDFRNTTTSLSMLATNDDHETYKRSLYFLIQRRLSLQDFIEEKVLRIRKLGYDHVTFLAVKEESSKEMQKLTDRLVNSISELANAESIKPLIESLKVIPPLTYDPDQLESRETSPPKTIEDKTSPKTIEGKTQKKDTGPKTP